MKKTKILLLILVILTGGACKKSWLEVIPQGRKITQTTEDYAQLGHDPAFYVSQSGGGLNETALMGDEVGMEGAYFNSIWISFLDGFKWADSIFLTSLTSSSYLLNGYYDGYARNSYVCNKIINEVMSSTGGTEAQKLQIMAEARANRAWFLFTVANIFCKPYNAATVATDPGMPFTTEAYVAQAKFSRGTLQETYDFIINDCKEALKTIQVKALNQSEMSKPAVEGLLGKVYLFMGKHQEALDLFNSSLADAIANGQVSLHDYNETLAPGGAFTPIDPFSGPVNAPGAQVSDMHESILYKIAGNIMVAQGGVVLEPKAQALFGPGDLRLLLYTDTNPDFSPNPAGRLRKYTEQYSRWGLELPDLYLMIAECKARLNDLSGSVAAVETLRRHRMPIADAIVPPAIASNQAELVRFIFDERTREFATQGMRWFDMRRIADDPIFSGIQFTHTLFNPDGTTTLFTLNQPTRLTVKLPKVVMDANPGMENNP